MKYINLDIDNIGSEHLCCAISDKKHKNGVDLKMQWIKWCNNHTFRKLDDKGKVFIEYSLLDDAFVPIEGKNYLYIYCLWVSGSYKGKGYAKELLNYCIEDGKNQKCNGICILTSKKKKPYLSEKNFFLQYGFEVVDSIGDYELIALKFNDISPKFCQSAKKCKIENQDLVIYYSPQCPYINNCLIEIENYCKNNSIIYEFRCVDTVEMAKEVPAVFNNWAAFYKGEYLGVNLLNEKSLSKLLSK